MTARGPFSRISSTLARRTTRLEVDWGLVCSCAGSSFEKSTKLKVKQGASVRPEISFWKKRTAPVIRYTQYFENFSAGISVSFDCPPGIS